jgi:5-methylcytosine-specific restriction endonuclease McrA
MQVKLVSNNNSHSHLLDPMDIGATEQESNYPPDKYSLSHQVLRIDPSGMPLEWISYQEAAKLYFLDRVLYSCGKPLYEIRGGTNAKTGRQSLLQINSIIASVSDLSSNHSKLHSYTPPLSNQTLFARDARVCLYCGEQFSRQHLSRDHILPTSQGGEDVWTNVATSCKRCNNHKAGRTPEQANMRLLAVPFKPSHAEYIYLKGRKVLADQMEFLKSHFPRKSPLRER